MFNFILIHNFKKPYGHILFLCIVLRIVHIHGPKITKNQTPWHVLLEYFTTRPSLKDMNVIFYQAARGGESVLTFEKRPLVAEQKLKIPEIALHALFFMFSISALPSRGGGHSHWEVYAHAVLHRTCTCTFKVHFTKISYNFIWIFDTLTSKLSMFASLTKKYMNIFAVPF